MFGKLVKCAVVAVSLSGEATGCGGAGLDPDGEPPDVTFDGATSEAEVSGAGQVEAEAMHAVLDGQAAAVAPEDAAPTVHDASVVPAPTPDAGAPGFDAGLSSACVRERVQGVLGEPAALRVPLSALCEGDRCGALVDFNPYVCRNASEPGAAATLRTRSGII